MSYGIAHALDEFQHSLAYAFLCRGLPVEKIRTAASKTSFWFELSDYVCYTIARAFLRRSQGLEPDINPDRLGNIFWMGNRVDNNLVTQRRNGIPWEWFEQ